jgi:hypothetical protein
MKFLPIYAALVLATSMSTAFASDDTLIKFKGGIGSQPFRSNNGTAVLNAVAGVNPGGAPWVIKSLKAEITTDGEINVKGKGLLLGGGDNIGTRGGARQVVASLFCRNSPVPPASAGTLTESYNSSFVTLDANGNFHIHSGLANSKGLLPPPNCGDTLDNRPILLIRTVTPANPATSTPAAPGAWFAAGVIKEDDD